MGGKQSQTLGGVVLNGQPKVTQKSPHLKYLAYSNEKGQGPNNIFQHKSVYRLIGTFSQIQN